MADRPRQPTSAAAIHGPNLDRLTQRLSYQWQSFCHKPAAKTMTALVRLAGQLQRHGREQLQPRRYAYASALLEALYQLSDNQPPPAEARQNIKGLIQSLAQEQAGDWESHPEHRLGPVADDLEELEQVIAPRHSHLVYVLTASPGLCAHLRKLLEPAGYQVAAFSDYPALLEQGGDPMPLAIITELPVPGADSQQSESLWNHLQRGRVRAPVIVVADRDDFSIRLQAVRCGAIAFYLKPLQGEPLLARLEQLAGERPGPPFRVLLVDDDRMLTELYTTVLEHEGYEVASASQPRQAIQQLLACEPDLILLDLYLPVCSGIDLAHMIRQYPRFETTPILFLSVENNLDLQLACARLSGEEFLTKPVAPWRMLMAVESRVLRSRRLGQEKRRLTDAVTYQAEHDSLTGLPNRLLFKDRLDQALAQIRNPWRHVAVVVLDVDQFQSINDVYGHSRGDELLRELARNLAQLQQTGDTLSRQGGDEFLVLMPNRRNLESIAESTWRLLETVRAMHLPDEQSLKLSCSIGIAVSPNDGQNSDELLKHADIALYHAKQRGGDNLTFFTSAMGESLSHQLELEKDLEQALHQDQFFLDYQPIVDVQSNRMTGVEALIRWRHPQRGLIPPLNFIPLAERRGQIGRIGRWVLNTACRQLAQWQRQGLPRLGLSVNLSTPQLMEPDLVNWLQACLKSHAIEAGCLTLEVTESVLLEEPEQAAAQLHRLRELGLRIAIDDFGTGYSSLSYMKHLPLDCLKVDKSFLDNLERPEDRQIVQAVIALARSLHLDVVAEGVETPEQLDHLRQWQCPSYQGYLYSKPTHPDSILKLDGPGPKGHRPTSTD